MESNIESKKEYYRTYNREKYANNPEYREKKKEQALLRYYKNKLNIDNNKLQLQETVLLNKLEKIRRKKELIKSL